MIREDGSACSGHYDSTMVAPKKMVSPGRAAPCGPASVATSAMVFCLEPPHSRLKILGRFFHRQGILRETAATFCMIYAAHKPSTRNLYHTKYMAVLLLLVFSTGEGSTLPFYQNGAELSSAFAMSGPYTSTIHSHISALSSCRLMECRWAGIPWLLSGCLVTDRKICLNDLLFLLGICFFN